MSFVAGISPASSNLSRLACWLIWRNRTEAIMRITRLDLLRYGKFTDKSVSLPNTGKDFHLIIGPNEAGKSTLRNAIQDLLFGIETRSRYNFLHPHSEMRLGALIEHGDNKLDLVRTKARTKTLQTPAGASLPDNSLTSFLGQVDRNF